MCEKRHAATLRHRVDYSTEMSDTVKPVTSFLIEDILSIKDSTRFNSNCCSQKMDRCSQWKEEEESEELSTKLCPQETVYGVQTGEQLQASTQQTKYE